MLKMRENFFAIDSEKKGKISHTFFSGQENFSLLAFVEKEIHFLTQILKKKRKFSKGLMRESESEKKRMKLFALRHQQNERVNCC